MQLCIRNEIIWHQLVLHWNAASVAYNPAKWFDFAYRSKIWTKSWMALRWKQAHFTAVHIQCTLNIPTKTQRWRGTVILHSSSDDGCKPTVNMLTRCKNGYVQILRVYVPVTLSVFLSISLGSSFCLICTICHWNIHFLGLIFGWICWCCSPCNRTHHVNISNFLSIRNAFRQDKPQQISIPSSPLILALPIFTGIKWKAIKNVSHSVLLCAFIWGCGEIPLYAANLGCMVVHNQRSKKSDFPAANFKQQSKQHHNVHVNIKSKNGNSFPIFLPLTTSCKFTLYRYSRVNLSVRLHQANHFQHAII